MDQASLANWMANVTDLVNELQTDHATQIALTAANKTAINAICCGFINQFDSFDFTKELTNG
jgi:hypothetical protein|tara:strand:- start:321 stop:506 length:186 start_codon:yes stop_codon:yes gene_type:complete